MGFAHSTLGGWALGTLSVLMALTRRGGFEAYV